MDYVKHFNAGYEGNKGNSKIRMPVVNAKEPGGMQKILERFSPCAETTLTCPA